MAEQKKQQDLRLLPDRFGILSGSPDRLRSELPFKQSSPPVPAGFYGMSGMQKLNTMLELPDPEGFVRNLPVQELHHLIHHIGLEDAAVLVPHTTQDQFKSLLYFDLWVGYNFVPERLERWVWALDEYGTPEDVAQRLGELDTEFVSNVLAQWTRIYMKETQDEELDLPDTPYLFASPDHRYYIEVVGEYAVDRFPLVHRMVKSLYEYELEHAHRVIDQVRAGATAEMEEYVLHFRNAWMEDFGFPPLEIAGEMYSFVGLEQARDQVEELLKGSAVRFSSDETPVLCTSLMSLGKRQGFLRDVLGTLDTVEEQNSFAVAFKFLSNRAATVKRLDLTDLEAVGAESYGIFSTLSIALEYLSNGSLDKGRAIISHVDLITIHRIGVSIMELCGREARAALGALGGTEARHLFDAPLDEVLGAAAHRFPLYAESLDEPGSVLQRPFENLTEVRRARDVSHRGRLVAEFFSRSFGLSARAPEDADDLEARLADTRLSSVWLTLLVHAEGSDKPALSPVSIEQAWAWLRNLDSNDLGTQLESASDALLKAYQTDKDEREAILSVMLGPMAERIEGLVAETDLDALSSQALADAFVLQQQPDN